MTHEIRAVFFDVGNTLLYPYPSVPHVVQEVLAEEGHEHDLGVIEALMPLVDGYYEDRYREDDSFWADHDATVAVWVGMYALLSRELEVDIDPERFGHRVWSEFGESSRWQMYDDVIPVLSRLRENGVRIGLVSNWDRRLSSILIGLGIGDLVDVIVSSADVGLYKPDPRIFVHALDVLGVEAGESAHVGDHVYADVCGARKAGLLPVLLDRHGTEQAPEGSHYVRTLDDLDVVLGMDVVKAEEEREGRRRTSRS